MINIKNSWLLIIFVAFFAAGCTTIKKSTTTGSPDARETRDERNSRMVTALFHDALTAKTIGNYEQALKLFRDVLKHDSNHDAAMYEIAKLLIGENINEASALARKAVELKPDNRWYLRLYAELLHYENDFEKATGIYQQLIALAPNDPEPWFDLAYTYERSGKFQEAIDAYDQIEEMIGREESITLQKHRLYRQMNDFEGAANELKLLIEEYPREFRYHMMLADFYASNGREEKARQVFKDILKFEPHNSYATFGLAKFYLQERNFEKIEELLQHSFSDPDFDLDLKISFLVEFLSDIENEATQEKAFSLSETIIKTHPGDPKPYALYGDLLHHAGKDKEALEQYQRSIDIHKGTFTVWQQAMFIMADLQEFKSLEEFTEEAMDYYPNQAIVYFLSGFAKNQLKDHEGAIKMLNQASLMAGGNPALLSEVHSNLGDAYHALEKHADSDKNYEKSLSYHPDNPYVLNNYSYYLSLRGENLQRAEEMSRKANELLPGISAFQDTYGWILYKKGNYEDSEIWLRKALDNGGDDQYVILDHYGDVMYKLGHKEKALKYWKKAKEKGMESEVLRKKINEKKLYE